MDDQKRKTYVQRKLWFRLLPDAALIDGQWCLQVQLPRRATDVDRLGVFRHNPVLGDSVPVGNVAPRQCGGPHRLLAGVEGDTVKVAEHNLRVVRTTERDIL